MVSNERANNDFFAHVLRKYHKNIYCARLTAPSVEMAKMTTLKSGAFYRPRPEAVDSANGYVHYVLLADAGPAL